MRNHVQKLRGAVLAACGALTLLSASAYAQSPEAAPPAPATELQDSAAATSPAAPVADKKIDQFADAYIAVQEIQVQATEQLSATKDAEKAEVVKQSAETQMIEAVERSGLQLEEFNQIVQAMASDTTLRERVSDRIGERKRTS